LSPCVAQVQSRAHALYAAERTLDGFCATRYTRRPAKKRDLCCPCSPLLIVIGRKCSSLRCCIRLGNWGSTLTRRASAQAFTRSLFLAALVDQLEPNRIRHDHLLTKLAENAARPPLMNAHSYRNQARTQYSQVRFECCRRALYQTFLDYDSVLVQTTTVALPVAGIDPYSSVQFEPPPGNSAIREAYADSLSVFSRYPDSGRASRLGCCYPGKVISLVARLLRAAFWRASQEVPELEQPW